jgi:hypothetical protein
MMWIERGFVIGAPREKEREGKVERAFLSGPIHVAKGWR